MSYSPIFVLPLSEVGLRDGVVEVLVQMVFGILQRGEGFFVPLHQQILKGVALHCLACGDRVISDAV